MDNKIRTDIGPRRANAAFARHARRDAIPRECTRRARIARGPRRARRVQAEAQDGKVADPEFLYGTGTCTVRRIHPMKYAEFGIY